MGNWEPVNGNPTAQSAHCIGLGNMGY